MQSLAHIKDRATKTFLVMEEIAPQWMAPNFISPNNFNDLITGLTAQESALGLKEAELAVTAGQFDGALNLWHEDSVLTLKIGRVHFGSSDKAPAWRNLTANAGSRAIIIEEGTDIAEAWEKSDALWVPKAGKTLALFKGLGTAATAKGSAHGLVEKDVAIQRGILWSLANPLYDLCVKWYEMATATFSAETPQGYLIRTIPVNYNPNEAPGQLQFVEHYSPAPSQVKLVWHAPRGQRYNIYAKPPGAAGFMSIMENATLTQWMGEGLTAGDWVFKGEAINAAGTGETSAFITVPVSAVQAA